MRPRDHAGNVARPSSDQAALERLKAEVDRGLEHLHRGDAHAAVSCFRKALELAPAQLPARDAVVHNLAIAYKQAIEDLLRAGDVAATNRSLKEAFDLELRGSMAQDPEFRGRFADAYYDLGKALHRARQFGAALACVRRAIAIQPCPSYYVDLTNALGMTRDRARLADYTTAYPPDRLGRHIFVACTPKSGSTFLKNVLVQLTQFKDLFCTYAALQNEHELDLPQLAKFGRANTVTQQHCRATEANIHLMQAFGIRPVVLVRDVFDSLVSLLDFYDGGFTFSTFFDRDDFARLGRDDRLDLLIEYVLPWYFQFVASWQRAEREGRLAMHWLTYEAMSADKPAAITAVLAFHDVTVRREDVERVVAAAEGDQRANRFNRGVVGRGRSGLSEAQRQRVVRLARFFPKADFTCLGL